MSTEQISNSVVVLKSILETRGIDHSGLSIPEVVASIENSKEAIFTIDTSVKIIYSLNEKISKRPIFFEEIETGAENYTYVIVIIYRPYVRDNIINKIVPLNNRDVIRIEKKQNVQLFDLRELQFDITKHSLVPKHEKITPEEATDLLEKYKTTKVNLPLIMRRDPVAKFIGLRSGDIVKITRSSVTAGEYINYRYCT